MRFIVHYFKMAKPSTIRSTEWIRVEAKNERWAIDRVNKLTNKDGTINRAFKAERV